MDRRDFLTLGGGALTAGAVITTREPALEAQAPGPFKAPAIPMVRVAYVGIGGQGSGHVRNLLKISGCRITAVCDVRPERTAWATKAIKCLKDGTATDMDVYDAAALSAVVPLSDQSAGRKAATVDCPDVTRGRWKTTAPLPIVHM